MGDPASILPPEGVVVSAHGQMPKWLSLTIGCVLGAIGTMTGLLALMIVFFGDLPALALAFGVLGAVVMLCGVMIGRNPSLETQKRKQLHWEIKRHKNNAELAHIREAIRTGKNPGLGKNVVIKWLVIAVVLLVLFVLAVIYVLPYVLAIALLCLIVPLMFKSLGAIGRFLWQMILLPIRILIWIGIFDMIASLFRKR